MASTFPIQTLHAIRVLRAIRESDPGKLEAATRALFEAMFIHDMADWSASAVGQVLAGSVFSKPEIESILELAGSPKIKDLVKKEAQDLVTKEDAFGAPWIQATKDDGGSISVFGSDRFEFLAWWLGLPWEGPVPRESKL